MALITSRYRARRSVPAINRVAVGLAVIVVSIAVAPAIVADHREEDARRCGEAGPLSTLRGAAEALRNFALSRLEGDDPGEGLSLPALLEDLRSLAPGATPDAWVDAALGHALLEAAVGASRAELRQLLQIALELAEVAPGVDPHRALLRTSCHIAESVLHSQGARPGLDNGLIGSGNAGRRHRRVLAELHDQLERAVGERAGPFVMRSRWRAASLGPGSVAPRYVARDTAGNEVRSTDFAGRITLYRVWDPGSPASLEAHRMDAGLLRKHWDRPFELVGISGGDDRETHLDALPGRSFAGTQIYDGPIGTELVDALARSGQSSSSRVGRALAAWHEPVAGSCILVDSRGVIRGRDLGHEELDALILELVDEHRLGLRERELGRR